MANRYSLPGRALRADVAAPSTGTKAGVSILHILSISMGRSRDTMEPALATPEWAAFCAITNQARARPRACLPWGLWGPSIYGPLAGTAVFNDITSGFNGDYLAGPGYDLLHRDWAPPTSRIWSITLSSVVVPAIISPTSASASVTAPFTYQIGAASNGPNSFDATGLPSGLSLNTSSGLISGTPVSSGIFSGGSCRPPTRPARERRR